MATDLLALLGPRDGSDPLLVGAHRTWTFAQLEAAAGERAEELAAQGVTAGAAHALLAHPFPELVIDLLACWRLGATVAPLHPGLTTSELERARAALEGARSGAQAIVWTSGTAGRPRGVELSIDNLRASAEAARARLGLQPSDVWLATLSPAHVGGLALITRALLLGSDLVMPGRSDASSISDRIDGAPLSCGYARPATHVSLVPTQLLRLLDRRRRPPPPGFRCALIGGAHAPAELVRRAQRDGWPIALTYGMTEMTSQVATAPPALSRAKPGTVGSPLDGVEVRFAPDGEILARGRTRAAAYLSPDEAGTLRRVPLADADGWCATGDLGHLDDDGHLWITGRRSDRIVSGGVTIDALEVEEVVRAHPSVVEVCVVGVSDPEWGERVAALVVGVEGEVDVDELADYARERLQGAKRPRVWRMTDTLPLNPNGKVDRASVRASFED